MDRDKFNSFKRKDNQMSYTWPDEDGGVPDARCNGDGCEKSSEGITPLKYHNWARTDHYGMYTGLYCDKCFRDNYPYHRADYFDPAYAGEKLEPED